MSGTFCTILSQQFLLDDFETRIFSVIVSSLHFGCRVWLKSLVSCEGDSDGDGYDDGNGDGVWAAFIVPQKQYTNHKQMIINLQNIFFLCFIFPFLQAFYSLLFDVVWLFSCLNLIYLIQYEHWRKKKVEKRKLLKLANETSFRRFFLCSDMKARKWRYKNELK